MGIFYYLEDYVLEILIQMFITGLCDLPAQLHITIGTDTWLKFFGVRLALHSKFMCHR